MLFASPSLWLLSLFPRSTFFIFPHSCVKTQKREIPEICEMYCCLKARFVYYRGNRKLFMAISKMGNGTRGNGEQGKRKIGESLENVKSIRPTKKMFTPKKRDLLKIPKIWYFKTFFTVCLEIVRSKNNFLKISKRESMKTACYEKS